MGARKPVTYSSLTININAIDATVTAVADYKALPNVPVRFEMHNHDDIWKIRQYWEDIGSGDTLIWFKLIDSIPLD